MASVDLHTLRREANQLMTYDNASSILGSIEKVAKRQLDKEKERFDQLQNNQNRIANQVEVQDQRSLNLQATVDSQVRDVERIDNEISILQQRNNTHNSQSNNIAARSLEFLNPQQIINTICQTAKSAVEKHGVKVMAASGIFAIGFAACKWQPWKYFRNNPLQIDLEKEKELFKKTIAIDTLLNSIQTRDKMVKSAGFLLGAYYKWQTYDQNQADIAQLQREVQGLLRITGV